MHTSVSEEHMSSIFRVKKNNVIQSGVIERWHRGWSLRSAAGAAESLSVPGQ